MRHEPWLRLYRTSDSQQVKGDGHSWWVIKPASDVRPNGTGNFVLAPGWSVGDGAWFPNLEPNPLVARNFAPLLPRGLKSMNKRKVFTAVYLYYRETAMLRRQAESWRSWPASTRAHVSILIVDDGSPIGERARDVLNVSAEDFGGSIVEIYQDLAWNIGGARNLAMYLLVTDYAMLVDVDLIIPVATLDALAALVISFNMTSVIVNKFPREYQNSSRILKPHPATMLLSKDTYWLVGGCDEDFVGHYGMTDPHFLWRSRVTAGVKIRKVSSIVRNIAPSLQLSGSPRKSPILGRVKNSTFNRLLFSAKASDQVPWAQDYIRFEWHVVLPPHIVRNG